VSEAFFSLNGDSLGTQSIERIMMEQFKLSGYEVRAYTSLLKQRNQTPKQLSSNAEIPMPRVYDTVESLMAKGFAFKQGATYSPISAKQALRGRSVQFEQQFSIEQRNREVSEKKLARSLELLANKTRNGEKEGGGEISILKGFNSIANKFAELLESSSETILIAKRAMEAKRIFIPIILEFAKANLGTEAAHSKKTKPSNRSKGSIRILIPREGRVTKAEVDEARGAHVKLRRSQNILFDMMVTDRDDVIIGVPDPLSEEINHAIAIWVRNSSFAKSTRASIEELWRRAEAI